MTDGPDTVVPIPTSEFVACAIVLLSAAANAEPLLVSDTSVASCCTSSSSGTFDRTTGLEASITTSSFGCATADFTSCAADDVKRFEEFVIAATFFLNAATNCDGDDTVCGNFTDTELMVPFCADVPVLESMTAVSVVRAALSLDDVMTLVLHRSAETLLCSSADATTDSGRCSADCDDVITALVITGGFAAVAVTL